MLHCMTGAFHAIGRGLERIGARGCGSMVRCDAGSELPENRKVIG